MSVIDPRPMRRRHLISRATGIARSLITYYGPVWRRQRMEAFYRQFLQADDLAFDIGAHVGNRVRVFRRIGAHVVAVEPQPDFVAMLRLLYGRDPDVTIEASGVAAGSGQGKLHLSSRTPTVSTFADSWMNDVQTDRRFQRIRWDTSISVPLVTLDELIARYGEPQFCKIDVEGFEHEVLNGLSQPLPTLSFEYIPVAVGRAVACVKRISALGDYRYRHSRVETHRWASPSWLDPEAMIKILGALPAHDRSGDVYAVRSDQLARFRQANDQAGCLAEEVEGVGIVELRVGDLWQVEHIGRQVGEVTIADRLSPVIAGAARARIAKAGIETIEATASSDTGTPRHERDSEILQLVRLMVRSASRSAVVGGQDDQGMASQRGAAGHGVQNAAQEPIGALHRGEIFLAHEPLGVSKPIRQREVQEGKLSRSTTQLSGELGHKPRVAVIHGESIDLGAPVVTTHSVRGTVGIPGALVKIELGLGCK